MSEKNADVFIQWKGTDVCLDFHCECGYHGHFDGYFAYALKCRSCERVYTMPTTLQLEPGNPHDSNPRIPGDDEE